MRTANRFTIAGQQQTCKQRVLVTAIARKLDAVNAFVRGVQLLDQRPGVVGRTVVNKGDHAVSGYPAVANELFKQPQRPRRRQR